MENNQFILSLLLVTSFTYAQFTNVLITSNNQPNEPSIMIDPNNTDIVFAAMNINNYFVSNDSGETWTDQVLTSSLGVWGDPVLMIDNGGDFYFFHLSNPSSGSWIDRIVCQKSTNNGVSFNDGTHFGLNGTKKQDKEWVQIDRNNGNIYVFWTEFDTYGSSSSSCKTRIMFVKSTDGSDTWSTPIKVNLVDGNCIDVDETVEGAVPAVGPNGEIYTVWSGPEGMRFQRSTDFGDTWLTNPILVDTQPGGWDYSIPGIDRTNGFPITHCDLSGGDNHGTIYVNWSDQKNGANDTDIWLKKSTDNGDTWSDAIRVNDDVAGNQQFLTWMDIDQTTGYLYCVFYDRRNHTNNLTDVYLARSTDGGETFSNFKISETPFLPSSSVFFGDYTNISAHNGVIRPIWTSLHSGQQKLWTALINENDFLATNDFELKAIVDLDQNYPNPATNETHFGFKLKSASNVSLTIFDAQGNKVLNILDNEHLGFGKHIFSVNLDQNNLVSGFYFYTLETDFGVKTKKMIVE